MLELGWVAFVIIQDGSGSGYAFLDDYLLGLDLFDEGKEENKDIAQMITPFVFNLKSEKRLIIHLITRQIC